MKETFCEKCNKIVEYREKNKLITEKFKNKEYSYNGFVAYCNECGNEVYSSEVEGYNLRALYDVYRLKNKIVSLEKVKRVPQKYDIGKRPLSLLLGWGELTYTRYVDGYIPTKQYSKEIKKIYDDPKYYKFILERGKALISENAYKKSLIAVKKIISCYSGKIYSAAEYLLTKSYGYITPMTLQKALYYVQGFSFAFNDKFIFKENCEAWQHGPVYRLIYYKYKDYGYKQIQLYKDYDVNLDDFTKEEIAIMDSVMENFCCYNGKVLEYFTHRESPWLNVKNDMLKNASCKNLINKSDISVFFSKVKKDYAMHSLDDIANYSKQMFSDYQKRRS